MELIVHLQDLKEGTVRLIIDHPPEFFELEDREFEFPAPVQGEVLFRKVGKNILARGWLKTTVKTVCVRCLEDVHLEINAKVELTYSNDPKYKEQPIDIDPMADIVYFFEGELIEPKEQLRELIMAELPFLPLCKPDCKGLCPFCGINLNQESCNCQIEKKREMDEAIHEWKAVLKRIRAQQLNG